MNLVNPAALAFAALAVPIVVFYILKVRLRRVPVSTLMFWRQIYEEKRPRSIWQRLRHLVSLLLQLAFLALLVFALADPIFRWQQARARRLVLVVDNSASMNARDVAPSRLEAAKAEGRKVVDGLRAGDELAVVAAGTQPQVYCGLTDHQRTLRDAIDAVPATDGPTRVAEAVALARRLVSADDKSHKVVVLSDGGFDGAAGLAAQADVELVPFGKATGNVGITRLQARRSLLDPVGYEILVEVFNASDDPADCRLELDLDDDPVDVVPLKLKPGEHVTQVFEKTSAAGGRLRARIDRDDALAVDNVAYAILPRRDRMPVTLVTEGNLFLEKVFEAMPLVDLTVVKALPPAPAAAGRVGLTVLHRKVPAALPPGPVLVIDPEGPGALWKVDESLQNPVVAKQEKDSPLMAHVRLDNVLLPEARKLSLQGTAQVLAESATGDPLYAVIDRPEGKVAVLTVNLDKGDLTLQTAFPIMMTNLLGWSSGGKGELREALAAGGVTDVDLPAETDAKATRALRAPDGRERPLPATAPRVAVGPLDRCGVWGIVRHAPNAKNAPTKAGGKDAPLAELACNLANRRETDLRPEGGLRVRAASAASGFGGRPIWYYLTAAAWGLVCWEWFLYQRRWID